MRARWLGPRLGIAVVVLCVASGAALSARAATDDKALHEQIRDLNRLTGNDAVNGQFKALVDDPKDAKKLLTLAKSLAHKKKQQFSYNAAFVLAHVAEEAKEIDTAAAFYRVCVEQAAKLQSARKLGQAYVSLIALYFDNQKYEASVRICKEVQEYTNNDGKPRIYYLATDLEEGGEPDFLELETYDPLRLAKPSIHRLMIQAVAKQGKFDEALKLAENLVKSRKEADWLDLQLKGWVYRESGKYKEAAQIYEDVLQQVGKDKELTQEEKDRYLERYRYSLSNIYVEMNRIDRAAALLKELLDKKPNDPTYNNDLGFIWADHDTNLQEAEKHIRKALEEDRKSRKKANVKPEEDRDNGAYLDSLGWVLFKQKKYKEAKEALLKAVEDKASQHIEIYDHLGDVYMALGQKAEAVAAWKKGLDFVTPSKRDQERKAAVEKKIKANE
jgi:tetratricopeptide (TPR) repeat protein